MTSVCKPRESGITHEAATPRGWLKASLRRHLECSRGRSGTFMSSYRFFAAILAAAVTSYGTVPALAGDGDLNVVRSVAVEESGSETLIRIEGTREPIFTVFKLEEPPRIVVDLSRTDISEVDRLLEVNRGNINAIITTTFEEEGSRMGRVMVVLEQDSSYDVEGGEEGVIVSIPRQVAGGEMASRASTGREETSSKVVPAPISEVKTEVSAEESLPDGVVARRVERFDDVDSRGDRVTRVKVVETDGVTKVEIETDGAPDEIEMLELVDPPRIAIDLHGLTKAPRAADKRTLSDDGPLSDVRVGRHESKVRVVLDGRGAGMPRYDMRATAGGAVIELQGGSKAVVARSDGDSQELVQVRGVTYITGDGKGQVLVQLDDVAGVSYMLDRPDRDTAVLAIDGAVLSSDVGRVFDADDERVEVRAVDAVEDPRKPGRVNIVAKLGSQVHTKVTPVRTGLLWELELSGDAPIEGDGHIRVSAVGAGDEDLPVVTAAGTDTEGEVHVTADEVQDERARYTGRRITLELRDVDIHNVLRLIAEVSRKNLVVSDDVSGRITLRLRNVPWDHALDLILRATDLDMEEEDNIVRIAPAARLAAERRARREAIEAQEAIEPLRVRLIPVNYATAGDMATKVRDVLSRRGQITVDDRTNSLIIRDIADALAAAEELVRRLDTETPQVLIEARIVEANVNFAREFGIQWGGNVVFSPATGNPTGLAFPNILGMTGAATDGAAPTTGTSDNPNFAVNMPAPIGTGTGGGVGFVFGSASGIANLNLRLSAMEQEGVIKTISSPRVQTLDNNQASISQGLSIPFSQVSAAGVNTVFVQAQLQLDVTPHVTADGSILMDVSVQNDQPHPDLTGAGGQPSISQKQANTNVMVRDAETMVIGGIYTRSESTTMASVPGLGRIPVLGWLFKKRIVRDERTELLVFITPRIVNRQEHLPTDLEHLPLDL